MKNKLTLLVLAAGMGSRFGGLKQLEPIGSGGETMLEYNVYDAIRTGFSEIVFVVREEFADEFKHKVCSRFQNKINIKLVYQKADDLPNNYLVPINRKKPWGTLHAVLSARDVIDSPFAVINADDFYGSDAFAKIANYFSNGKRESHHHCMVGYPIIKTLELTGEVNRGVCVEKNGFLVYANEQKIVLSESVSGVEILATSSTGEQKIINNNTLVSLNCWGFQPEIFILFTEKMQEFLAKSGQNITAESFLPDAVSELINDGRAQCQILSSSGQWFGITYPEDKQLCINKIAGLISAGDYPPKLWM